MLESWIEKAKLSGKGRAERGAAESRSRHVLGNEDDLRGGRHERRRRFGGGYKAGDLVLQGGLGRSVSQILQKEAYMSRLSRFFLRLNSCTTTTSAWPGQ